MLDGMCLLAVLFQVHPDAPLVVAANRDELLDRPASPFGVLRALPATLGGKDELHGGTWLAVNRDGVVAALTNAPSKEGRDPGKRTRGELPLRLTLEATAEEAATLFAARVKGRDYNPCWLLVADRAKLFHIVVDGSGPVRVEPLGPGVHVLENRPLRPVSPKAARLAAALERAKEWRGEALAAGLRGVLSAHDAPDTVHDDGRPLPLEAACVHAGPYGTRSSSVVLVPDGRGAPRVFASDGPPCTHALTERTDLWGHQRSTERSEKLAHDVEPPA
jgi:uncharacterized protein with NRDE domain